MKTFYLFMKQSRIGCDHTIECGTKCVKLNALTKEEAISEANTKYYVDEFLEGDFECKTISILEVHEEINLLTTLWEDWKKEVEKQARILAEKQEKEERNMLEELKKKYEAREGHTNIVRELDQPKRYEEE